ncbi:aminotransferase class IV [Nocardioides luteus]|uniref:aminotransferase class IV n=1 Tax=Nocardioides luteus TaxID=1844 RepID=UPI000A6DBB5A|nr:aminotransferase class IV [Nocardioides luteus]
MGRIHGREATAADLSALALTGFGHFTSMHVEGGGVKGLDLHLDRLARDCRAVFDAELDRAAVLGAIRNAIAAGAGDCTLRVTVFDPDLTLANLGTAQARPIPMVTTRPSASSVLAPMRVLSVAFQREMPSVKHVGLFGQLRHRVAAKRAGFDDVLFVDPASGRVSEGCTWNVGFVTQDGEVVWPDAAVLPGVTMALVADAAGAHVTRPVLRDDVLGMRAAFAPTRASAYVRSVPSTTVVSMSRIR